MLTEFIYDGGILSTNELRSNSRYKYKNKIMAMKTIFRILIRKAKPKKHETYSLELEYNTRHDPDNITPTLKYFQDMLKTEGIIKDDSPKYCKGISIIPNDKLNKGQLKFMLHD